MKEKNITKYKIVAVLIALITFVTIALISFRAQYLNILGISSEYISVFSEKIKNKYTVFATSAIIIYVFVYVLNIFTKKGLKQFFDEEKKEMPKLPNKSFALVLALIGGAIASTILADKYAIFSNAAIFGQNDPIFNVDIGYYMFSIPFIESLLIFIIEILIVAAVYVGLYYVITLNICFDGVEAETLKKNIFIKQEVFIVVLITVIFGVYVFVNAQNILTGKMLSIADDNKTELIGAGKTDVTIKLWGYRILSFVIVFAVLRLLRYIKKQNFKQGVISVLVVPAYLFIMFAAMIYTQSFHVKNNELDNENEYIAYNIKNTKTAYGIDIDQQNISNYDSITYNQVNDNQDVIRNIPVITKSVTSKSVSEHQENIGYYNYDNTFLALYDIDGENKLVYVTPREVLNNKAMSYNNRTLKYTHGFSTVVSTVQDYDSDGYAEYLLSDFTTNETLNIKEPRIYFGMQTNSTILVDTDFGNEYDYPITATTNKENVYEGKAGLKLGFFDRLILAIDEQNFKLVFPSKYTENTKIISNRNIIERAKKLLPEIIYDENPYLVVTDEGKLVWVIDGYTTSDAYPYSQITTITARGYKEKINYIRNSVKVLVDAYDGTTTFFITDKSDPIIMTYRNMYPKLFSEDKLQDDIANHFIYPKFLYKVQSEMISKYHDISSDTLYRANDLWQISSKASTSNSTIAGIKMEPYYTMVKTVDSKKSELGLVLTYNKYGKQNITSYLVGTVKNGKSELSLYKFDSKNNVAGILQLNNQIEQDSIITKQLADINTSGTKLIKDMIIVPINNTLVYVEPIYQVMLNDVSEIPVLKKIIVASGNKVAIGDNLEKAFSNLFSTDYSAYLEFIDIEDINTLIDSVIKANNNLEESLNSNNFEMIGKDISSLQDIIKQLEIARKNELEKEENIDNNLEILNELIDEQETTNE